MSEETLDDPTTETKLVPDEARDAPVVKADPPPTDGTKVDPVQTWPTDWREKAAAGDEKKLAKLSRYASPQAVADALLAAQTKLGEKGTRLPKDATPEQIAAWREDNGIPDKPEKYDVKLDGIEIGEQDKPLVDKFLASAHGANMTKEQVKASLQSYYEAIDTAKQERQRLDVEIQTKAEDTLRAEWGQEYRRNINLVTNLLDGAGEGMRDKILLGRLADGTPIGSSPEALKFLTSLALERNPTGVITPSGSATETTVQDEITKIETIMRKNRSEYNRDQGMQERYRQLLDWRIKNTK
jgi:hypothetical protein